jgi:hypothetical protein
MRNKTYTITIDPTNMDNKPDPSLVPRINRRMIEKVDVTIDQFGELVSPPKSHTWSPGVFQGTPSNKNWRCQSIFGLDFDHNQISVKDVWDRFNQYGIVPQMWYETFSSTKEYFRFRVVLFLDNVISDSEIHQLIAKGLLELFPEADPQCKDQARYYFGGKGASIITYTPTSLENLVPVVATFRCSGDSMRTRNIPLPQLNEFATKNAPEWALLYNYNKRYHPGAEFTGTKPHNPTSVRGGELQRIDFEKSKDNIKIFREFLNGTWLNHMELFGLATNLSFVNGGFKIMRDTMNKFNSLSITQYTPNNFAILTYLKKVQYPPQPIKEFSPFKEDAELMDLISESIEKRGHIKIIEPFEPISLSDAESRFKSEFNRVIENNQLDLVYLFRVPTALGKTQMITEVNGTVAAPTNDLKSEIGERMEVSYTMTPDPIVFENNNLQRQLNYYYSIGLPNKANQLLYSLTISKNKELYSNQDIENANQYINQLHAAYTSTSTVLTTHQRAIHSSFSHDTIIFDEDPLKTLINIKSLKISDLFQINISLENKELDYVIKSLQQTPVMEIRPTPVFNLDLEELIFEISQITMKNTESDVIDFFCCSFYTRDTRNPDLVHYVIKRELPINKKVIILTATAPLSIYKCLFGDRIEIIDMIDVQQTGKIIQYTKKSFSRNSLKNQINKVSEEIGDIPVITFKSFQGQFLNPSNMWFGNCSGYDQLKGTDIAVVGTPHINNVVYFLTAKVLGIDFKTSDTIMSFQKVIHNGFEFKFNCFDHEELRMIQFSYIESELIQAVGRARTLRTNATVHLYSNYPLRITTEFR